MTRRQKRREPYPIDIEKLSHEGRGVGRLNGKTVFVRGALPGESVVARTLRKRSSFDEAETLEVTKASAARIEPHCQHATVCGGCSLQHLSADDQIAHKESVLFELLQHHAALQPLERRAPLRAHEWGYRRKARLGVKFVEKKGGALVGFREKAAPYIADIDVCPVLHPQIGEHLHDLRALINSLSIESRVPQIEVAVGDDSAALVLRHLEAFNDRDIELLEQFQSEMGLGIYLQPGGEDTVHALNDNTSTQHYEIAGVRIDFAPTDFTQVNSEINRQMVAVVIAALQLQAHDVVLDLFCGLGNFTLPIARITNRIVGFEGSDELVARAKLNATANDIDNATFLSANLDDEKALANIAMSGITKILLDPPRTGANVIVENLDFSAIERVVYVSCNPVTLARDSKVLTEVHGFVLESAGVMDMFPHTSHVESLAVFRRP